ncbi:AAA family ATPase [Facklamia sp. DSM 111018]|uniref:Shikimate kinase n=1 Tax=Facklamia lactis TaxID=2749967 RepID=A0ABS0LQY1_9LACT|nr:shikimate kinase [Facklamia lactis]MBG9979560.1 AAA family ATPase [Facklamia lactis]MBG9985771.1 AAA family ATPase [Facklamia lactis]
MSPLQAAHSPIHYGLLGRKLGHSYSQTIHQELGSAPYQLIELEANQLGPFLIQKKFRGLNVTLPYKESVIPYLDHIDPLAQAIGSVNTILNDQGRLYGYNTDYAGFAYLLNQRDLSMKHKRVLILGSGGSAKMIRQYAQDHDCQWVQHLSIRQANPNLNSNLSSAQIIVNATPVGMYPHNLDQRLNLKDFPYLETVIDLIYNPLRTELLLQASALGIQCQWAGGLDMLIAQAFHASQIFKGETIPLQSLEKLCQQIHATTENWILIGMPGAGKSTLARHLAKISGRPLVDTDHLIEAQTGQKLKELIPQIGEPAFRELEAKVIAQITKEKGQVIASGGGAILKPENRQAMKQNGRLILLKRPLEELTTKDRPLAKSLQDLEKLWQERQAIYQTLADLTIKVNHDPNITCQQILKGLKANELVSY